jgi:hypothetical protein
MSDTYTISITRPDGSIVTYNRAGTPAALLILAKGYRDLLDTKIAEIDALRAATVAERVQVCTEIAALEAITGATNG